MVAAPLFIVMRLVIEAPYGYFMPCNLHGYCILRLARSWGSARVNRAEYLKFVQHNISALVTARPGRCGRPGRAAMRLPTVRVRC
jgi:hypothetical protein